MISKNFKILLTLIFAALIFFPLKGEDKIDIWKIKKIMEILIESI